MKRFEPYQRVLTAQGISLSGKDEFYWCADLYSHYFGDGIHITMSGYVSDDAIISYEGNEELIGKTVHKE